MQLLKVLSLGAVAITAAASGIGPSEIAQLSSNPAVRSYCTKNYSPRPTITTVTVTRTTTERCDPTTTRTTITGGRSGTVTITSTSTDTTTTTPTITVCGTLILNFAARATPDPIHEKRTNSGCPSPPRAMKGYDCNDIKSACESICAKPQRTITKTRTRTVTVTPTVTRTAYVAATTSTCVTVTETETAPAETESTYPDFDSDSQNCGSCGNACEGDTTCQSGTCRLANGCAPVPFNCALNSGQGSQFPCGANGNCICFEGLTGAPVCTEDYSCPEDVCDSDNDCDPGYLCTQDTTCCAHRSCAPTAGCSNELILSRIFRRKPQTSKRDGTVRMASGGVTQQN